MKNLESGEKRDITLNYLAQFKDRQVSVYELNRHLKFNHPGDFTLDDTKNILKTLALDGFTRAARPNFYQVTLKGVVLCENGGYNIAARKNIMRTHHVRLVAGFYNQDVSLYKWMLTVTIILVVSAILRNGFLYWHWVIPF